MTRWAIVGSGDTGRSFGLGLPSGLVRGGSGLRKMLSGFGCSGNDHAAPVYSVVPLVVVATACGCVFNGGEVGGEEVVVAAAADDEPTCALL